jgi:cyclopropane fatty-acyl-phospholipid synthase-like methyltransferase
MLNIIKSSLFSNSNDRNNLDRIKELSGKKIVSDSFLKYEKDYFDGGDEFPGYGKYRYDGRYEIKVQEFINFFNLNNEMSVIEFGCAKAFILFEFYKKGFKKIKGVDYSYYAISDSPEQIRGLLEVGDASNFKNKILYDVILSKEMLPHLDILNVEKFISNLNNISSPNAKIYLEIQYGETFEERKLILDWDPTHKTLLNIDEWLNLFSNIRPDLNLNIFFKKLF